MDYKRLGEIMVKSRIDTPGLHSFKRGAIRVTDISLVVDHHDCRVWEVSTKERHVDIHTFIGGSPEFDGWSIRLDDHDSIMASTRKYINRATVLNLDLNPNKKWYVIAKGSKSEYTIFAYARN